MKAFKTRISWIILGLAVFSVAALPVMAFAQEPEYPQVDISGYKSWDVRQVQVLPKSNYSAGVTHLGFSPTLTSTPWEEKLQLSAVAQMNKELKVTYNISQQPLATDYFIKKLIPFSPSVCLLLPFV